MYVYLKGSIDVENCFLNCVRESEKALLVPMSTKRIMADHEHENWNPVNKIHIEFNNFIYSGLDTISL